eukprot:5013870-Amphidinium_carterae.1
MLSCNLFACTICFLWWERGPGCTGPEFAVDNGIAVQANKALQRRAAKGRPRSWRGGCRRRACRRLTRA